MHVPQGDNDQDTQTADLDDRDPIKMLDNTSSQGIKLLRVEAGVDPGL